MIVPMDTKTNSRDTKTNSRRCKCHSCSAVIMPNLGIARGDGYICAICAASAAQREISLVVSLVRDAEARARAEERSWWIEALTARGIIVSEQQHSND